jgi:hypothetical protein
MPPQMAPPENATEMHAISDELQLENFGYKQGVSPINKRRRGSY